MIADYKTVRLAGVDEGLPIHALLLSAQKDIPLTDKFGEDAYKEKVRSECAAGRVWVVGPSRAIRAVMVIDEAGHEIFYLVTDSVARGQGLARALIQHAKSYAKANGWSELRVKAQEKNLAVLALLRSEGFAFESKPRRDGLLDWLHGGWFQGGQ